MTNTVHLYAFTQPTRYNNVRLTCSPEAAHGVENVVSVVVEDDGEVDGDGDEGPLQHGGSVEGLERRRGEVAGPADDGPRLPRREPERRRQGRRGDLVQRAQDARRVGTWKYKS